MSGHGLHADCRGRAGVGAHTQRSCFRALVHLRGLVPCRRTAGLCLPVTAGGPWARQTFSCCERRGMLTAESHPGQAMAFSGVHLGQFQRNQSKDLRIKSQFLTLYMNCFCIFWQFKIMFPNTRLPGFGTAEETYFFHLFVLHFLWIPLFSLSQEAAWRADLNFRLPPETSKSSLVKLALQGWAQSDPLDPHEESL